MHLFHPRTRPLLWATFLLAMSIRLGVEEQAVSAEVQSSEVKRPNVLFIYTDDHSHRTIGCYPEAFPWVSTPNIDRLAASGVRFTHAYIGTWCMPSRASMLTGHHATGIQSMRMEGEYPGSEYDPALCRFWPSDFRRQGYFTAQIGKWHTGTDTGFGRDWDHQRVWNRPRYPENSGAYYYDQLIETDGGPPERTSGYSTDNYTRWAQAFIRGEHRDETKPWYLWLCYAGVHGPFTPADRHLDRYPDIDVPVPQDIYPPRPGKPAYMQDVEYWVPGPDGQPEMKGGSFGGKTVEGSLGIHGNTLRDWVRQYHQSVLALDESVGALMETLRETGQLENTLVIFTSDQGIAWGQHGFCIKLAPYDATIRSPLIIAMPETIEAGGVCPHPVAGVDLVPTIYNLAGLDLPWTMHGRDLSPLLRDPTASWPHPAMTVFTARSFGRATDHITTDPEEFMLSGVPWWLSLAQGHYKYIRTLVADEIEELYDLRSDPEELTNLALDPAHQDRLGKFREALVSELRQTGAKLADHLPPVKQLNPQASEP